MQNTMAQMKNTERINETVRALRRGCYMKC